MAEQVLDRPSVLIERPMAAFFMPESDLSASEVWEFSTRFAEEHQHLLRAGSGLVSSVTTHRLVNGFAVEGPPAASLVFDMRHQEAETIIWQLTEAQGEGRAIRQLIVTPSMLTSRDFVLDAQGKLIVDRHLSSDTPSPVVERLMAETDSYIEERHEIRRKLEEGLAEFAVHQSVSKDFEQKDGSKIQRMVKLGPEAFKETYEERQKLVTAFGFIAIRSYEPIPHKPNEVAAIAGTLPIDWPVRTAPFTLSSSIRPGVTGSRELMLSSGRLFNPASFQPAKHDLRSLDTWDRQWLSQLQDIRSAIVLHRELSSRPDNELSPNEAVDKQSALVSITRALKPFIYERQRPAFPNGIFRVGSHTYRYDASGFYVTGEDTTDLINYRTFGRFQDPCRYQFAVAEQWVDLAADILSQSDDALAK